MDYLPSTVSICIFCVDSIELDDGQSDAESTDSTPDVFANIPLPSATVSTSMLPCTNSSSPAVDAIPLPKSPVGEKSVQDSRMSPSPSKTAGHSTEMDADAKTDEFSSSARAGDAVHAKTSVGTITLLLNRKLGPRLNKASVFDIPDDNVKEVNRRLVKLRRLKRMKKNKDGASVESESGPAAGPKTLQQRILEWKEELLNDQNFKKSKQFDSKSAFDTATSKAAVGDTMENQPGIAADGDRTDAREHVSALTVSGIKTEAVDTELVPSLKSDDSYMIKLKDTFVKVWSCNDALRLDWPREMVHETEVAPKLVYSCNPLYFNFRKLLSGMQQNADGKLELKKHRHKKKHKKSHTENTDNHAASSKAEHQSANSLDVNKDILESSKTLKSASHLDTTKEHTKKYKSLLDPAVSSKKSKKSAAKATKPDTSPHPAQSKKRNASAADKSRKRVSGSQSQTIQPTVAEDDLVRMIGAAKDTDKSRWDTSSDSETEPTRLDTTDRKTSEIVKSKAPASADLSSAKTVQHRSRSRSLNWSSDNSARSRKRSRYRSTSSASSYSCTSSSYRSSSYSYHGRHRLSRSSSSYSYSASDYSHSSRSYSRSRSTSRRRRWQSRSYSRSQSSSVSRSPPRRAFGGQPPPRRGRSGWRSQATSKQSRTATQQTKPSTHPPKTSKVKTKTDSASEVKNNSDVSEPLAALTGPSDGGSNSAEAKESTSINTEESEEVATGPAVEDVKCIPTPEEHMQSIPLPVLEHPTVSGSHSFIGPVLPSDHPLAHKQDIPLPATAKFQHIGPNDPLVFRSMPPPPPPPALLTSHSEAGKELMPPPRPPSPPEDMEDDIAGDEDPIPQMLDVKTLKPATFIPPEQDEQYGALRRQAERHARRQRIREETGMDIDEEEEEESTEAEEQVGDQVYIDEVAPAAEILTPILRLQQQHLVGQPLSSNVAVMAHTGSGLVPIQMVSAGVGVEPPLVPIVQQNRTATVLAVSPAVAALARAQEEAEAEAQVRQRVAAAQAIAAAHQRQRAAAELVQLLPGHLTASSPALATLRPAGLPLQAIPVQAIANQQPQQQLVQLPDGRIVGVPNVIQGGVRVIAQPQAQPAPLVIGPNGTILRIIR